MYALFLITNGEQCVLWEEDAPPLVALMLNRGGLQTRSTDEVKSFLENQKALFEPLAWEIYRVKAWRVVMTKESAVLVKMFFDVEPSKIP